MPQGLNMISQTLVTEFLLTHESVEAAMGVIRVEVGLIKHPPGFTEGKYQ